MIQAEKKPSHSGGKAINEISNSTIIITKNRAKSNSNIIPFPSGAANLAVPELDCLSIFGGEGYPTPEEWEKKYLPNGRICPLCEGDLTLTIQNSNEDADIINLDCEQNCSKPYIYGELNCMEKETRFVKRQKGGKKADPGYNKQEKHFEFGIKRMSEVTSEEIDWLWFPYIPYGKLTIIDGDPGIGKTFLCLDLCSRVSTGDNFFLETGVVGREGMTALYCVVEDGAEDTISPRLDKMNADRSKILVWDSTTVDGVVDLPFNLQEKFDRFEKVMEEYKPKLVIIDPIQAYIGADMNAADKTRPALQKLVKAAEKHKAAIVLVRHTTKGKQQKGMFRGMGSQDILGVARSALYVGADKNNPDHKIMTHSKGNLAKRGVSLMYVIEEGKLVWKGESTMTADDLNDPDKGKSGDEEKSAIEEAIEFLEELFKNTNQIEANSILQEAKKLKISDRTLKRAKSDLKITSQKRGNVWYWVKE